MKLEVGMYVRTEKGEIKKVFQYDKQEDNLIWCTLNCRATLKNSIVKASYNIIDLIEEGDYVNGYKVSFKDKDYKPFVQCDYPVQCGTTNHYRFYEEGIKDIVTKEQFESMKYEVK